MKPTSNDAREPGSLHRFVRRCILIENSGRLTKLDRKLWGIATPFVVGVNVGAALTVLLFVICYLITGGK